MAKPDLDSLLAAWEENYKKGLLTFWLLLILHEREAYAFEMSRLVSEASRDIIRADENSIYRALNRFEGLGLVASSWHDSDLGPPRRYYRLTDTGRELLRAFIRRNVLLFQDEAVARRIQAALDGAGSGEARR
ncbi:MAG: PadR family transcriptional regulator [Chloroflexota bacterium]